MSAFLYFYFFVVWVASDEVSCAGRWGGRYVRTVKQTRSDLPAKAEEEEEDDETK